MKKEETMRTAVVMTNRFPWSDLVVDGEIKEKQGAQKIKHRGLVLLRTAKSRIDSGVIADWELKMEPNNLGYIVGAAELVGVGGLPGEYEYTFRRARRFRRPVEFNPRGPVRWARVPLSQALRAAVKRAGLGDLL